MTHVLSRHTYAAVQSVLDNITAVEVALAHRRRTLLTQRARTQMQTAIAAVFRRQSRTFVKAFTARHQDIGEASMPRAIRRHFYKAAQQFSEAAQPRWDDLWDDAALATLVAFETALTKGTTLAMKAGGEYLLATLNADISFDLENPRAVDYLTQHGAELVTKINEETRGRLRTIISDGVATGDSYTSIAGDIRAMFTDMSVRRSELIAQHESSAAFEQGNLEGARQLADGGLEMQKAWNTAGAPCDVCSENEAQGWIALDTTFTSGDDVPPGHVNCLPGFVRVSAIGVSAATKRLYDGDLVVIRTASGKQLACTPNHPILTDGGWVAAGLLNKGSHVISSGLAEWVTSSLNLDNQDMPPRIEDVAESFGRSEQVTASPVPTTPEDFHGDGVGSKIAIVWANRLLRDNGNSALSEHVLKHSLLWRYMTQCALLAKRHTTLNIMSLWNTAHCCVSSFGIPLVFFGGASGHRGTNNIPYRTFFNARFFQPSSNYHSRDAKAFSNHVLRHTIPIQCRDFLSRHIQSVSAMRRNTVFAEKVFHRLRSDAQLGRDLCRGLAGLVFVDAVIDFRREQFTGHVYNLQTQGGYYIADGIITHNCHCYSTFQRVGADE